MRKISFGSCVLVISCVIPLARCGRTNDPPPSAPVASSSAAASTASATQQASPASGTAARSSARLPELRPPSDLDFNRSPEIPLGTGLTIVNAIVEDLGDYEVVMRISVPADDRIQVSYSATVPVEGQPTELRGRRTVLRRDLDSARIYKIRWLSGRDELARGTTALGLSREVFGEVRAKGRSECSLASVEAIGSAFGALGLASPEYEGVLERVEAGPVPVPVVVDGERAWLPALHAKGTFEGLTGDVSAEFWFLDDPSNPLTLRAVIDAARLVVVRIDRPQAAAAARLERALGGDEAIELRGVYFEFASAKLRRESASAIAEAAEVLRRHPDWKVRLEGHTDSVGSTDANLSLSRARAEAVRQAIVERLDGRANQVEAAGFGDTRPRESNEAPEGRARNRRVEIVRLR